MDTYELIRQKAIEKIADFNSGLSVLKPVLGGAALGAGFGALNHMILNDPSERFTPAAMLNGALAGGLGGALGSATKNNSDMNALLLSMLGGSVAGAATSNMSDRWVADQNRIKDIEQRLTSPYLSSSEKNDLIWERDAINEMTQEDLQEMGLK